MSARRPSRRIPASLPGLLAAIYEGPLEPRPWQGFAEALRVALGARNVAVTLHHAHGLIPDTWVMAGDAQDPTDWDAVERVYRERFLHDDPDRPERVQPGEVVVIEAAHARHGLAEFLAANGIGDCLRTCFAEPEGMRCWIDVVRARSPRRPWSARDVGLLRDLLPHLDRALRLYARQSTLEAEKTVHEDTIDHFQLGSVLLDGELRVVHANRAAGTLIAAHPGVTIAHARLRLADPAARRAFESALARALAASRGEAGERRGELVRLETADGGPLGLLVYPVRQSRYYRGAQAPSVVVYLSDPAHKLEALQPARESSQVLVARLFGLTPQEARLALLLADGCTLAAAAGQIGVAESAARSYSKRIYAKMGINSQSDIVRLVHRSFALLR